MKELMFSILLNDSDVKWSKEINHIDSLEEYLNDLVGHDLNGDNKVDEYDYELYLDSRVHSETTTKVIASATVLDDNNNVVAVFKNNVKQDAHARVQEWSNEFDKRLSEVLNDTL